MVTSVRFADLDQDGDPDHPGARGRMDASHRVHERRWPLPSSIGSAGARPVHGMVVGPGDGEDLDGDGDQDLISREPRVEQQVPRGPGASLHVYWADFDDNGRSDIVLAKEKDGTVLPVRGRECSSQQCPMILDRFPTYKEFAHADLPAIYTRRTLTRRST